MGLAGGQLTGFDMVAAKGTNQAKKSRLQWNRPHENVVALSSGGNRVEKT
jgi:hypothetical protein